MIVVTGATGKLGRAIVEALMARTSADHLGVSVRDPGMAGALETRGVRVRQGDFDDPDSLAHSFAGAKQVLIVSSNVAARGGDPVTQHRTAIAAAREAGVRHIVYTSHMAASATSAFPPMRDHAATEDMLRESGVVWTALRHGFYADSAVMLMGDALRTGVLEASADGKVSWTTHDDLAAAAAAIVVQAENGGPFEGATAPLTGSEALDLSDLAGIASEVLGRSVDRRVISDEALRGRMAARGVPSAAVGITLGLYAASREGEFSAVDPTLERLIGRRPRTMRAVIASAVDA